MQYIFKLMYQLLEDSSNDENTDQGGREVINEGARILIVKKENGFLMQIRRKCFYVAMKIDWTFSKCFYWFEERFEDFLRVFERFLGNVLGLWGNVFVGKKGAFCFPGREFLLPYEGANFS